MIFDLLKIRKITKKGESGEVLSEEERKVLEKVADRSEKKGDREGAQALREALSMHKQVEQNVQHLDQLKKKAANKEEFTEEDLRFLYNVDDPLLLPGNEDGGSVTEITDTRNIEKDLAGIFNCEEDQISTIHSLTVKNLRSAKEIVYHYGDVYDIFLRTKEIPEGARFPKRVSGTFDLSFTKSIPKNITFPEQVGRDFNISQFTSLPEGIALPRRVGDSLWLHNLTHVPQDITFTEQVGENVYLHSVATIDEVLRALHQTKHVGGEIHVSENLKEAIDSNPSIIPERFREKITYLQPTDGTKLSDIISLKLPEHLQPEDGEGSEGHDDNPPHKQP